MAKPGRRPKNANAAAGRVFGPVPSADMLKRTLREQMFNKQPEKWTMPDDAELERLSTILRTLRSYATNSTDMWAPHDQAVRKATEQLVQLKASLFDLLRSFESASAAIDKAPAGSPWRAGAGRAEPHVRAMIAAITRMQNHPVFVPVADKLAAVDLLIIRNWDECILPVASECEAVLRTKPGNDPKVSRDGPFTRFLAALIPSVTGQDPTAPTVAEFLMTNAKRPRSASSPADKKPATQPDGRQD